MPIKDLAARRAYNLRYKSLHREELQLKASIYRSIKYPPKPELPIEIRKLMTARRKSKWQHDNKDKHNASAKEYRVRNKEKCALRTKQWAGRNKERYLNVKSIWRAKNRHRYKSYKHNRRALIYNAGHFTAQEWLNLCDQYGNQCLACHSTDRLTPDHVVPLSLGGSNNISNIQPLCLRCNLSKHNKIIDYRK